MIGDFVLGRLLGQGAYARVKLGTHLRTGEEVAIKTYLRKLLVDMQAKHHPSAQQQPQAFVALPVGLSIVIAAFAVATMVGDRSEVGGLGGFADMEGCSPRSRCTQTLESPECD